MWPSEQIFADLLTKQKRKWQKPAPTFKLCNSTYKPDFFLPKENLYIEVIASRTAYLKNLKKYKLFKKLYPHLNFVIVDLNNNPYPYSKDFKGEKIHLPSMRITISDYKIITAIAKNEGRFFSAVLSRAIQNYGKLKKINNSLDKKF